MAKQRPAESEPEDASLPVAARALSPRERRRVRTMREIQGRALALFTEQGYGQTTIEQIAEASDISARTFFRYFPTKEDVVFWDEYDAVVLESLDSWPADLPLGDRIRSGILAWLAHYGPAEREELLDRWRIVIASPVLRNRAAEFERATAGMVLDALRQDASPDGSPVTPGVVVTASLSAYTQIIMRWAEEDGRESLQDVAETVLAALRQL